MNFEETVKSMSASDIIMAMVKSLTKPPLLNVDMNYFGRVDRKKRTYLWGIIEIETSKCFGCAATNTICQISGKLFDKSNIEHDITRANFLKCDTTFLNLFERAINELRVGCIRDYNEYARLGEFARITRPPSLSLPVLRNDYMEEDLIPYKELAKYQQAVEYSGPVQETELEHEPATGFY